jgi:P27 family predicted phage terminase small subunit
MTRRPGGGRKPKPTHLKLITGNLRPSRVNPREPRLEPMLPAPPAELIPEARAEWDRLAKRLLAAGLLTAVDGAVFACYCQSFGRWQQAEQALAQMAKDDPGSDLVTTGKGGNSIQNPLVGIARRAAADCVRYAAEFGMTPSARSRVWANPNAKQDPADHFFDA